MGMTEHDYLKIFLNQEAIDMFLEDQRKLADKWHKTGLLEGLLSENAKLAMARLLENQARQLVTENSKDEFKDNKFQNESYAGIILPLVRYVFNDLVERDDFAVMHLPADISKTNCGQIISVTAKSYQYKTHFNYGDLEQDLTLCYRLDAEAELTSILAEEFISEFAEIKGDDAFSMYIPFIRKIDPETKKQTLWGRFTKVVAKPTILEPQSQE
jgi:hypothetical protein